MKKSTLTAWFTSLIQEEDDILTFSLGRPKSAEKENQPQDKKVKQKQEVVAKHAVDADCPLTFAVRL